MADHLHAQIRAALATALTGLASTGANVFRNRLAVVPESKLPALCIFADSESAEIATFHIDPLIDRVLNVTIEARAKGDAVDDTLDQISLEVEAQLALGVTVAGRLLTFNYAGMEYDDELADKPIAVKRLRFTVSFTAAASAPDTLS